MDEMTPPQLATDPPAPIAGPAAASALTATSPIDGYFRLPNAAPASGAK